MITQLGSPKSPTDAIMLYRDIAIITTGFFSSVRGKQLGKTRLSNILRLPNGAGLLFNFCWGKTLRDGSTHVFGVASRPNSRNMCPMRCINDYVAAARRIGWTFGKASRLFPIIRKGWGDVMPSRCYAFAYGGRLNVKRHHTHPGLPPEGSRPLHR